jgi:catalase
MAVGFQVHIIVQKNCPEAFMSNQLYARYSDDTEFKQPDEERLIDETIASFERMRRKVFDKHRHAMRGAHAKGHGVLKGELTIYDNLPVLAQGLFRKPRTYPVIIRFSTAPGDIMPDGVSSFRGMAIKVIGVEGRKFLEPPDESAATS